MTNKKIKNTNLKCWIVDYSHKYGHDVWPIFSVRAPTLKKVKEDICNFEPSTEHIEIEGPWSIPCCCDDATEHRERQIRRGCK